MRDYSTAKVLNNSFSNIVSNLNIAEYSNREHLANNISDPVLKCVVKYTNHPNILAIGKVCSKHPRLPLSFSKINSEEILRGILKLETSKACQDSDIPTKITRENADIFADMTLLASFNDSVEKSNFPSTLKNTNKTLVFKKGGRNSKDNYRPVRILPNMSKIFQRSIFRQLCCFMLKFLSKYQCGFRKDYSCSTQLCLLAMVEKWKCGVDEGKSFGALLTDLSKVFDCLSHKLLLPKLHVYGFSTAALRLIHRCLTNRKQRTKVNFSYSP